MRINIQNNAYISPPGRRDKKRGKFALHKSRPISKILIVEYLTTIKVLFIMI